MTDTHSLSDAALAKLEALASAVDGLARLATQPTSMSSVELSRNAKGDTQAVVKVYGADPDLAARQAQTIYDALTARYTREVQP